MKDVAAELFGKYGLEDGEYYDLHPELREVVLPKIGKSPRQIWIDFGNAMRAIHSDVWVDEVSEIITSIIRGYGPSAARRKFAFIITDVRFPNEAEAVKSWGGTLMEIRRNSAPVADDPAEHALDVYLDWDWTIDNHGSLDDIHKLAVGVATCLDHDNLHQKENPS